MIITIVINLHSTATKEFVSKYEKQCQDVMASKTVNQFKALFPASATPSKLLTGKVLVELWFLNVWGNKTLDDLKNLVSLFGVPGKHLHLSKVKDGCIVTWLCSTWFITELKAAIVKATDLLRTKGVLKVLIEEELVLECSQGTVTVYTTLLLPYACMYAQQSYAFGRISLCTCICDQKSTCLVPYHLLSVFYYFLVEFKCLQLASASLCCVMSPHQLRSHTICVGNQHGVVYKSANKIHFSLSPILRTL